MEPILFNTEMVRAILEGRKTVTRRVIKSKDIINSWDCEADGTPIAYVDQATGDSFSPTVACPHQPGDILYVRETWYYETFYEDTDNDPDLPSGKRSWRYVYKADNPNYPVIPGHWRPSIHMPREAARIFLRVTGVQIERLQDITEAQAEAEGVDQYPFTAIGKFCDLWDSTIKPADRALYGWTANPWVWVIEFERTEKP